jgi:hypothetical protein
VTATPVNTRVARGTSFVVRVTALPAQRNQQLAVQIKKGERWKNVARGSTNKHGRDKISVPAPRDKGLYVYRVVGVAKGSILAGASTEFPIRVTK